MDTPQGERCRRLFMLVVLAILQKLWHTPAQPNRGKASQTRGMDLVPSIPKITGAGPICSWPWRWREVDSLPKPAWFLSNGGWGSWAKEKAHGFTHALCSPGTTMGPAFLLAFALLLALSTPCDACECKIQHPQTFYCMSDIGESRETSEKHPSRRVVGLTMGYRNAEVGELWRWEKGLQEI